MNTPKDYSPPRGGTVTRVMCRCSACRAWWSTDGEMRTCPCGGELESVSMEEHLKTIPVAGSPVPNKKEP